ncbi:MAG: type II toxin-antitoxin system RelE/ParE family toxin [Spirochaetia bacterium]
MTKYILEVVQSVDFEVAAHRAFLETRRIGLGDQLLEEIRAVFAQLKENPKIFQKRYGEFRIALTKNLRYKVIYHLRGENTVRVVAVRHPRQHPTSWM